MAQGGNGRCAEQFCRRLQPRFAVVALLVTGIAAAAISPTYSINGIGTAANPTQTRLVGTGSGSNGDRLTWHAELEHTALGTGAPDDHGRHAVGRVPWRRPRRSIQLGGTFTGGTITYNAARSSRATCGDVVYDVAGTSSSTAGRGRSPVC